MRLGLRVTLAFAFFGATLVAGGATAATKGNWFNMYPLVSDTAGSTALRADASLVNGWGLSAGPTTPWWTSNNGTNTSTLYNGAGMKSALTVTVPGGPTGTVFNGNASAFVVTQNGKSGSARFLFATQAGKILGWSPTVNGTVAIVAVDNSSQGALYEGLATLNDRLYATDFHNGRVDVFDSTFKPVRRRFTDTQIPKGWAPFGIQALGGNIFVTYAKQDTAKKEDVAGGGLGYVDQFTPDGALARARREARAAERAAERAVGARDGAGDLRRLRRRPAGRQLRQRPDQRVPGDRARASGSTRASSASRRARSSRSTASGRSPSGTARAAGPDDDLYFLAGPTARSTGCSASSPSAEDTAADVGPGAVCPGTNVPVPQVEVRRELAGRQLRLREVPEDRPSVRRGDCLQRRRNSTSPPRRREVAAGSCRAGLRRAVRLLLRRAPGPPWPPGRRCRR